MAAQWQRAKFKIPKTLKRTDRLELAQDIIDQIRRNAERGWGVPFGEKGIASKKKKFPGYSEEYVDSLDFKIAGKSAGSVDLTLSGDMLASIELLNESSGEITVGFERGTDENARADGNIRGTYGAKRPDSGKARNFLGLSKDDFNKLLRKYTDG